MLPYRDDNPSVLTPFVTVAIIIANVVVWVLVQGMGMAPEFPKSLCELGLVPGEFLGRLPAGYPIPGFNGTCLVGHTPSWITPLTSMFLHGGWMHLIGNMWFLWIFGDNIEDSMGHGRFLIFYILSGLAAAGAQMVAGPSSAAPLVGASGAISGVMGAYIVLYPRVRVHMFTLLLFYPLFFTVNAFVVLGFWFLVQLFSGGMSSPGGGGVAFWAHVGGFLFGALLIGLFKDPALVDRHRYGSTLT